MPRDRWASSDEEEETHAAPRPLPAASRPGAKRKKRDRWASDSSDDDEGAASKRKRVVAEKEEGEVAESAARTASTLPSSSSSSGKGDAAAAATATGGQDPSVVTPSVSTAGGGDDADGVRRADDEAEQQRRASAAALAAYNPLFEGCRSVDEYEKLNSIAEGTYGMVFRARCKQTGDIVALKQVKFSAAMQNKTGFPITAMREINVLLAMKHENIINVREMVVGRKGKVFMVMDYMEHDLKMLLQSMKRPLQQSEVKCLLLQLLEATAYMHGRWIMHRDLKTSNLLFNNQGRLNICDFGLARKYGEPLRRYTTNVVTLWYRAPELLLGQSPYDGTAIDMWSNGCIFAEMLDLKPLIKGEGELDQLLKTFRLVGSPSEENWPGYTELPAVKAGRYRWKTQKQHRFRERFPLQSYTGGAYLSDLGLDLLRRMLALDPTRRITAAEALKHAYFREPPLPKSRDKMPTFAPTNDGKKRNVREQSPGVFDFREHFRGAGGGGAAAAASPGQQSGAGGGGAAAEKEEQSNAGGGGAAAAAAALDDAFDLL